MIESSESFVCLGILPAEDFPSIELDYRYYAKGFVEDLIVDLSRFSNLMIIDSHSVFSKELAGLNDGQIAKKLGADFLLKTSFRKGNGKIRLVVQLISPESGNIVWAERYDTPEDEIFELQESVVEKVTQALSRQINIAILRASQGKPRTELAAYDCWLRGYQTLKEGTVEADAEARVFFQRALEIDPQYARAYVGLSLSHFNDWSCQMLELAEASECFSYEYAKKAIQLNEDDHIAQYVLGRVMIYRKQFDLAEEHVNRAISLNPNDADILVQLGFCKSLLGDPEQAVELYNRASRLNPLHETWYFAYGAFNYFCLKDNRAALDMAYKCPLKTVWLDISAFIAISYAYLGDMENAVRSMSEFRNVYREKVNRGSPVEAGEEIEWLMNANPFREETDREYFLEGMRLAGLEKVPVNNDLIHPLQDGIRSAKYSFTASGGMREIVYKGSAATLTEVKGFKDLEQLLGNPREEIHCTELMGVVGTLSDTGPLVDEKARLAYRERICELQAELDEAEKLNDLGKVEAIRKELDPLLDQLAVASGLGGRTRKFKDPAERARSAVTWRIRSAIKKLETVHPEAARHFRNSIRTGFFCSYEPETELHWRVK